jgi:hypothetical protein
MTTAARCAHFEIEVDGVVCTHRDVRDTAIETARYLQWRPPGVTIAITDLRDDSPVRLDRTS